jgi:membrane-bound lytic murein transglycosylase A
VRRLARAALAALAVAMSLPAAAPAQVLAFEELDGWWDDRHLEGLESFLVTCDRIEGPDWAPICALARDVPRDEASARSFFELFFRPVVIGTPPALFTGYYEPELRGSLTRTPRFAWPIYRRPPELRDGQAFLTRGQIDGGALRGRGLELVWLEDPVELYFLQVQGSGRIRLPDGQVIRVGYAGRNGHPYRSIGQELIRRGTHRLDEVSAQEIRAWVRANGAAGQALLATNPSYVFFRRLDDLPPDRGPIGAMGRSLTTLRSVAVDPDFTPLGAPVWVEKDGRSPIRRLMVAQDTGGAIKGAQRADIFFGTGEAAGEAAGRLRDGGRLVVLMPIDRAYAMMPGG